MQSGSPVLILLLPSYIAPCIHVLLGDNPLSLITTLSIHVYKMGEGLVEVWTCVMRLAVGNMVCIVYDKYITLQWWCPVEQYT
jgi:hypothetical protein